MTWRHLSSYLGIEDSIWGHRRVKGLWKHEQESSDCDMYLLWRISNVQQKKNAVDFTARQFFPLPVIISLNKSFYWSYKRLESTFCTALFSADIVYWVVWFCGLAAVVCADNWRDKCHKNYWNNLKRVWVHFLHLRQSENTIVKITPSIFCEDDTFDFGRSQEYAGHRLVIYSFLVQSYFAIWHRHNQTNLN